MRVCKMLRAYAQLSYMREIVFIYCIRCSQLQDERLCEFEPKSVISSCGDKAKLHKPLHCFVSFRWCTVDLMMITRWVAAIFGSRAPTFGCWIFGACVIVQPSKKKGGSHRNLSVHKTENAPSPVVFALEHFGDELVRRAIQPCLLRV